MRFRIANDKDEFPETGFYWVEELVDGEWREVVGTLSFEEADVQSWLDGDDNA